MAATFTEISLEDMERFLKRAFRTMRPKKGVDRGEIVFDLSLSPNVVVRVWTSIGPRSGMGAEVGADAIRVQLLYTTSKRPLFFTKAPIVKRTQGWKSNLQDRIEDAIEKYEDREDYWEEQSGGKRVKPEVDREEEERGEPTKSPSDRLVDVMTRHPYVPGRETRMDYFVRVHREAGFSEDEIRRLVREEGDALKEEQREQEHVPPPPPRSELLEGRFTKYKGEWAIRVEGEAQPGDRVMTVRQDGRRQTLVVRSVLWKGRDNYTGRQISLCSFSQPGRSASASTQEEIVEGESELEFDYDFRPEPS